MGLRNENQKQFPFLPEMSSEIADLNFSICRIFIPNEIVCGNLQFMKQKKFKET